MCLLKQGGICSSKDVIGVKKNCFIQWSPLITTSGNMADWKVLSCKEHTVPACTCLMQYRGWVAYIAYLSPSPTIHSWQCESGHVSLLRWEQLLPRISWTWDRIQIKVFTSCQIAQCVYLGRPFVINSLDWSCKWNVVLLVIQTDFVSVHRSYLTHISTN